MSDFMTSNFLYSPEYKTQCISLNAQAYDVPRGTIICAKGVPDSPSATATFTGTAASLSGEAETYTPEGTVSVTVTESGGTAADGTFDIVNADGYGVVYGVLLSDVKASASAQSVDVITCGELFREYINSVYKAGNGEEDLPEATVVALRSIGILLK